MIEIKPKYGLENIKFGDKKEDIKSKIDSTYRSMLMVPWDLFDSDVSEVHGIVLSYDENGQLEYVTAKKFKELQFLDIKIKGLDVKSLIKTLEAQGYKVEHDKTDEGCYYCDDLGLNFSYRHNSLETIQFYNDDYFSMLDKQKERAEKYYEFL